MMFLALIIVSLYDTCHGQGYDVIVKGDWGYNVINGPATWHYNYPLCAGEAQSPIEIITRAVEDDNSVGNIVLNDFQVLRNSSLVNNGHTISLQFEGPSLSTPTISSGYLLDQTYIFQQAHWHWSRLSEQGSEHHIDGLKDPVEMHLVHMNSKYTNLTEAFNHGDGVAVLALLYEVSEEVNEGLIPIVNTLATMNNIQRRKNGTENIHVMIEEHVSVSQLLPYNMFEEGYYYYKGSLTTPSCSESVSWAIFPVKIGISETQLEVFREASTYAGDKLSDNFRPTQELNGRIVKRAMKSSVTLKQSELTLIVFLFVLLLCDSLF